MLKNLFLFLSVTAVILGCSGTTMQVRALKPAATQTVYSITEDFENASPKNTYLAADVKMSTGSWSLEDALVGGLESDLKNGLKCIRLRSGKLTMNFDVSRITMLYIKHGKYGSDPASFWQLMMSQDGGITFNQVGKDIHEDNDTLKLDSFEVSNTSKIRFQIKKKGDSRINIDDITFKGAGALDMISRIRGKASENTAADVNSSSAPRGVVAGADAQPSTGDNSNLLFGNPSDAHQLSVDNFLINKSYYTESYSSGRGTPNWVSWHLDASNMTAATDRLDNFAGFTGLPAGVYQVQNNDYEGSGFDRGHHVPSADRTSSANANSATFLMTNMIPQAPQNNQQTWNNLEGYLRTKVLEGNEIYIIMGSYGMGGSGSKGNAFTIANGKVTVPSNVWKVAVIIASGDGDLSRVSSDTRVIAVNTPNINTIERDWKKYRVSVRTIEKATGYNLLSILPKNIQLVIEAKADTLN